MRLLLMRCHFMVSFYLICSVVRGQSLVEKNLNINANISDFGNNTLFLRWRPTFHFLAPAGHMNDPCGPMYDQRTDTYHLFYQSFPNHVNGGNGSWGHAISKDLVTWKDIVGWKDADAVALKPDPYPESDWIGVWTGGAVPVSLHGQPDGNLTIFYTCVSELPVGWTDFEPIGAEKQCIATSSDGGITWQKYHENPILDHPPPGWNFTGFRDPSVKAMPELDAILGMKEQHYYMVLGSGIKGAGPRMPLYAATASDITTWTYLGALFDIPGNHSFRGDTSISGSFGFNFELPGFFPLLEKKEHRGNGKTVHFVVHAGTEGGNSTFHPSPQWTMFGLGSVSRHDNGSAEMSFTATGPLDWGNWYAANSFFDSKHDRQVIWGWSDESAEMPSYALRPQGFQGALGLPRELFVKKVHRVLPPLKGIENDPASWTRTANGTYTVMTLGSRPLPDVVASFQGPAKRLGPLNITGTYSLQNIASDHFRLHASFDSFPSSGQIGFVVRESPGMEEFTKITWAPSTSILSVSRQNSSLVPDFSNTTISGYFEPYTLAGPTTRIEPINVDIFVDGSLLEILINDRFALTTRVYPTRADSLGISIYSAGGPTSFSDVVVYDKMMNVWPERPWNSSSPLHFDPYYDTHVTFENPYVPEGTQLYEGW